MNQVIAHYRHKGVSIWKYPLGYMVEGRQGYRKSLRAAKQATKRV